LLSSREGWRYKWPVSQVGGATREPRLVTLQPVAGDVELLERMRAGDQVAFAELVERYHTRLVRFAGTFVASRQSAEDVAQDTWLAVIRGVERFEGRSSLQTWLYRICANRARSRGGSDRRAVPIGTGGSAVSRDRFDAGGAWVIPPEPWNEVDERLLAESLAPLVLAAVGDLPDLQRQVVTLRDVEGLTSRETCEVLSITEANQRVLLHRARSRVRSAVEDSRDGG
jgi:RNA polymerase sigma-70 factor (ECF subfamily)